jgi:regulatory protein
MGDNNNHTNPDYKKAEKIALRLIARAEQCSCGLARKLEKRGCDAAGISEVISRLCELNLLDDSRFARMWLQSRLRFARSPRRLLSSLYARGIDHDIAQAALKEALDEQAEFAMLEKFAKKRAKKAENVMRNIKFQLKNEGFSASAIQRFMEED